MRRIIEDRFGKDYAADKRLGDLRRLERLPAARGDRAATRIAGYRFELVDEERSPALDVLLADGFCENVVERRPELDRWTLYHTRGPEERHLCQLDYILLSPALARRNATVPCPTSSAGPAWRTVFPPGQEVERFPRVGWDRPKASDHCPVAVTLDIG